MPVDPRLIAAALIATAAPAHAAPTLHSLFSDHAVLQRDVPIRVWGSASPGEVLVVRLAGAEQKVRADRFGHWLATLPARGAGGPYRLEVAGSDRAAAASDVMIGDVFLCSGQSNMEWPVQAAMGGAAAVADSGDPGLRLLSVGQQTALTGGREFAKTSTWQVAGPDTVKDFSAVCYFMARELRRSHKVAFGLIDASWGGTPIRAWTDESGVRAAGMSDVADLVALYRRSPAAAMRRYGELWSAWWRAEAGTVEPWKDSSGLDWKQASDITDWNKWDPSFAEFNGAIWARKRISLNAAEAGQEATLSLGVLDDLDATFVNGVPVGSTNDWSAHRNYPVPEGLLRPGENEILVYVRDNWGPGGFHGPAGELRLSFPGGHEIPLAEGWQYARLEPTFPAAPLAPWDGPLGASTIYHGMIAPLGPFGLRGVAWYQGESDVGQPGYDRKLQAMMASWRRQFKAPRLPFLIVGLAGFGTPVSRPIESGWARLIDEQRKVAASDQDSALVSAIDLGEWSDIHPTNKMEVGRRAASAAGALIYGEAWGNLGASPLSATRTAAGIAVRFNKPLQALSGGEPLGFELCGPVAGSCRFRPAKLSGDSVVIADDGQAAVRVRYAWGDFPIVNLYDQDLLPVPVFELAIAD